MSCQRDSVLIVGARPTGLVLAIALLKHGIEPRIIDQSSDAVEQLGNTLLLHSSIYHSLDLLGVLQETLQHSSVTPPITVHDLDTSITTIPAVSSFTFGSSDTHSPRKIALAAFTGILEKQLVACGGQIERSTKLVAISPDDRGESINCQLHSQRDDSHENEFDPSHRVKEETFRCGWIVDTDGADAIRSIANIPSITWIPDESARLTYIHNAEVLGIRHHQIHVFHSEKPSSSVIFIPQTSPSRFNIIISGAKDTCIDPSTVRDPQKFQRVLEEATGRADIRLHSVGRVTATENTLQMAKSFRKHRILLVGNGAYSRPSLNGSDASTGIDDSINLAWKLALVCKGISPADLLDTHELERLPIVADTLGLLDQLQSLGNGGNSRESETSVAIQSLYADPVMNYRHSPIVMDDRDSEPSPYAASYLSDMRPSSLEGAATLARYPRAGDRAPDVTDLVVFGSPDTNATRCRKRLYELFANDDGAHTILVFPSTSEDDTDQVGLGGLGYDGVWDVLESYALRSLAQTILVLPSNYHPTLPDNSNLTIVVDTTGNARRAYGLDRSSSEAGFETRGATYVLVRPDGYIGCFGTEIASVERYFSEFFCC